MTEFRFNKPLVEMTLKPGDWTEENNKLSILRAAGICKGNTKALDKGVDYFDEFIERNIIKKKKPHLALLQHVYTLNASSQQENLRDSYILLKNHYDLIKLGKPSYPAYQFVITTNYHTAIQLRTHVSPYTGLSILSESTRAVDYSKKDPMEFNSIEFFDKDKNDIKDDCLYNFLWYTQKRYRLSNERAGRFLTTYRQVKMIITGFKHEFKRMIDKRTDGAGAQSDAEYICLEIKRMIEEAEDEKFFNTKQPF